MYEAFFKFQSRPFASSPNPRSYFPAQVIEAGRQSLARSVERAEGVGLIIGPPGTGKTLLCQLLAEQFAPRFAVALLTGGRLSTCQALLQSILYELRLPFRGLREGELRLSLMDYLEPSDGGRQGLVLIVDEAHTLSAKLLDELRLLTNLIRDGLPRVRLVLAGSPLVEERLASPRLGSFSQRVATRVYLEPLDKPETANYVRAQFAGAGQVASKLIDDDALTTIYRASDGIPRLINQVCDHALILASLGGQHQLTSETIDEAWADLQQLPTRWSRSSAPSEPASAIVEFGRLDDGEELPAAIPFPSEAKLAEPPHLQLTVDDEGIDTALDERLRGSAERLTSGGSHTEVDLEFPEFVDPFGEEFAEEEVVLNRYGDVDIFAEVPRVSSWEGDQISAQLAPLERTGEEPCDVADELEFDQDPQEEYNLELETLSDSVSVTWDFTPALDPVLPEETPLTASGASAPLSAPYRTNNVPAAQALVAPAAPSTARMPAGALGRDVIVVEDGPASGTTRAPAATAVGPAVRKGEFRQLFAKLRRS